GQEKWKLAVEGGVMSSACVAGGVAYFGGNDGNLYAVDAATGQVKWKAEGQGRLTCSPAVAYGIVFMEGCWGFDAKTGKPVWSTTRQRLRGSDDDRLSSLGLHRDILIHNGSVLDIKTARHLTGTGDTWASQNTEPFADSAIYDLNSGVGGAVNLPRLIALDMATGRSKWTQNIVSPGQSANERKVVLCSPAVWDGKVFLGFDGGLMFAFDAAKGNKLWTFEAGGAIRSSPSVSAQDGLLYFGSHDGHLYALDARTGHERWRFKTAGKVTSSPCPADGVVFVGSDDGHLYALEGK
ncbi:MAG: hypothetical protein FJ272_02675, partial [Planctomycetes bacterium]|nr:hypothetical protein [Planctomycetota bacterium]